MRPRCAHYALTPTPVRAVRCRRRAVACVRVGGGARAWAVCAPCTDALRVLWGGAVVITGTCKPG